MEVNELSKKIRKLNLKPQAEKKKKKTTYDVVKAWIKSLPRAADIAATETPIITKVKTLDEKSFTYTHLGQLQFILPEVVEIQKMDDHLCLNLNFSIIRKLVDDGNHTTFDTSFYEHLHIRKLFQTRLLSFYQSHPESGCLH
ncbi:CDT1-like protein a, chloroplastic [Artemisia annua]|uniref:CDT1-like protein a, chloroplastic n=1 Tax=Artemisia annua TaxID=35608 RepID=A0A2U1LLQ6_ARTAN|nr:CDT1-like protein a, chloroplastic [Artemisia annua]